MPSRKSENVTISEVRARLRKDLASGKLELNSSQFINQQHYATKAFLPRKAAITLIREVLRELFSIGFVKYEENKGFSPLYNYANLEKHDLKEITEEIIEVTRIRLEIETRAIRLAVARPQRVLIERAKKILDDEERLMAEQQKKPSADASEFIMGYINLNNAFHLQLGHQYPRRINHILRVAYSVFDQYQFTNLKRRQAASHQEHRDILASVERRNKGESVKKLRAHIIGGAYAALQELVPYQLAIIEDSETYHESSPHFSAFIRKKDRSKSPVNLKRNSAPEFVYVDDHWMNERDLTKFILAGSLPNRLLGDRARIGHSH